MSTNLPDHHGPYDPSKDKQAPEQLRLLLERASVRNFSDQPVTDNELEWILKASCQAPTGGNLQPYSILVIRDVQMRERLAQECGKQSFMANAPVHLIHCLDFNRLKRWAELMDAPFSAHQSARATWIAFEDTIMSAQNACTAADILGMGSVYIGTIIELLPELRKWLNLPSLVVPLILTCIGWPKAASDKRNRLPLGTVVHNEVYREQSDQELLDDYEIKYKGRHCEVTSENMETLLNASREIGGAELEMRVRERVNRDGYINTAQYYFGLHYIAPEMRLNNLSFKRFLEEAGFAFWQYFG